MPRTAIPFTAPDISALAKALRDQLARQGPAPGHVEMLNILARAAGAKNFQHFRARSVAPEAAIETPPADLARVEKLVRQFDAQGRLVQWPAKPSQQALALWAMWAALPAGDTVTEPVFNARLNALHTFGAAILRRAMVSAGLVSRTLGCRDYRRVEQRPPPEAQALIRRLRRG